jgi:hypothetical protein
MRTIGERDDLTLAQQIAALNQVLLVAARRGDWPRVRALEKKRRAVIQNFLEDKPVSADPCLIRCIREIIRVDREIVRLSLVKRRTVLTDALKSSAG